MIPENTHTRIIQDLRYAGEHPLVQFDILDARTLLRLFHDRAPEMHLNSRRLGRLLTMLEMRPIGLCHIVGQQCKLWTCLPYQPTPTIIAMARDRALNGAVELHKELEIHEYQPHGPIEPQPLLPSFERQILELRMQPQGMRYPRPREIAKKMDCAIFQVNRALQTIRRRLGLATLKDMAAVRKAVSESGALQTSAPPADPMDDPMFR